jgi:hypothetical protein
MSYRMLFWLPIVAVAPLLAFELAMPATAQSVTIHVSVEIAKASWLAGAIAAAFGFEPGDYLRRGWLLVAAASALFLVRDATTLAPVALALPAATLGVVQGLFVIAGNGCQVAGVWVLSRVWSAAGLDEVVRGQRRSLFAGLIALSLLLTAPSIVHDAIKVASGNLVALPHLASDVGDCITFVLLAALIRTALALRGGVVFWIWSLFAASEIAWMLFDGARTLTELFGATWFTSPLVESLRVIGAAYFCAAGLAQRWVVSGKGAV